MENILPDGTAPASEGLTSMATCKCCGAPLLENVPVCSYCHAKIDVDLSAKDFLTVHAPEKFRTCPVCKKDMDVLNIGQEGDPFYIDRCPTCLGIFLDTGELDAVVRETVPSVHHIAMEKLKQLKREMLDYNKTVSYRACPVCGKLMNRENYGKFSGVIVDRCRIHGVYLDAGELQLIQRWVAAGGSLQLQPNSSSFGQEPRRTEPVNPILPRRSARSVDWLLQKLVDLIF